MKTPREILLERHRAAEQKLDAIRQSAVATVTDRRSVSSYISAATILQTIWRELFFPSRRIWTSLAAVWVFIFIVNFSLRDHPTAMAKMVKPEIILSASQQQELLTEIFGPDQPRVAEPQKPYVPRPSSQRSLEIATV